MGFWDGMFYGTLVGVFGYLFLSTFVKIISRFSKDDEDDIIIYLTEIYQNQTSKDVIVVEANTMIWDEGKKAYKRKEKDSKVVYYYDKIEEGLEVYGAN
jgi:hypothetical protein